MLQVLAEMAPIEKIRIRQNGWRMIYFHHRDTEVSQRILNEVFRIRLYGTKALKARLISAMGVLAHGHENQNTFPGFGRKDANPGNEDPPKRWAFFIFTT